MARSDDVEQEKQNDDRDGKPGGPKQDAAKGQLVVDSLTRIGTTRRADHLPSARRPLLLLLLLFLQCVLGAADGILHLAGGLVGLALGFQLGIAGHLTSFFLDGALGLLGRTRNTILVHRTGSLPPIGRNGPLFGMHSSESTDWHRA